MFIKKYLDFVNEGRSEVIDTKESALDVIKKHAPWYLESDMLNSEKVIYRGLKSTEDFLMIDSSKFERKPLGNGETFKNIDVYYYNNIMNESDRWNAFSNISRNKSIFATNSLDTAKRFARTDNTAVYVVIPLEADTDFVMSMTSDSYNSFTYIKYLSGLDMIGFSKKIFEELNLPKKNYTTITELKQDINSAEEHRVEYFLRSIRYISDSAGIFDSEKLTMDYVNEVGGIFEWINILFDPVLNQFQKIKYNKNIDFNPSSKYNHHIYPFHELWTDKPCLLIRKDLLS